MCQANGESLVVSYTDICTVQPILAIYVADAPTEILSIFDRAAKEVVLEHFPAYEQIRPEIHVRINDLPVV
jgi:DNA replication licensing factor MCM2